MYSRRCPRCDADFIASNARRRYCDECKSAACRSTAARKTRSDSRRHRTKSLHFIGVDGEGITDVEGNHHYVLLSVGDRSLTYDGKHLPWDMVFDFLYDQYLEYPDSVFVGFYLGYDFTQWLRTMPEGRARALLTTEGIVKRQRTGTHLPPFPVIVDGWEIDALGTRRFKLRPHGVKAWMTICDAGPFYQSSFLRAIDPSEWDTPIVSADDYAVILEGKQHRSTAGLDRDMIRYNVTENRVMGDLMKSLAEGFAHCDIKLGRNQWFGPGQAAQAWLTNINAPLGEDIRAATPQDALTACQESYYGGWFEIFRHGPQPGITYEYDINSAYPNIIASLPDFRYGVWSDDMTAPYVLVRALVSSPVAHFGAMPHRLPDGRILRPRHTGGWYWLHELEAAERAGVCSVDEILSVQSFTPDSDACPYSAIRELYLQRLEVGKNSPAGKALKLMYNSAYGKMAQSIGTPKYAAAVCASLITAGTRTMILDAIASHPRGNQSVVMVATDGVYFDSPHPTLPLSSTALGQWDVKQKVNLSVFMPGVYWDDEARDNVRRKGKLKFKSRGINANDLAPEIGRIDEIWESIPDGTVALDAFPSITLPIQFGMVTATEALARGKWWTAGHVYSQDHGTGRMRTISAQPSAKRYGAWKSHGIITSNVWEKAPVGDVWSTPYEHTFGNDYNDVDALLSGDGINAPMEIVELLYE